MKVSEVIQSIQGMPVCDRLYLLCQLLQRCVTYELAYLRSILLGNLSENLSSLSTPESLANKMDFLTFNCLSLDDEVLDKVICSLSLLHYDNRPVAQKIFSLLSEREILAKAEENESQETLDKLRLLYVLAVYHPAMSFNQQHHLLTIFLRHLDELYELREKEIERKKEEAETIALAASERPSIPSDEATIRRCELKGVYKRQSDKRYPYILEVEWSNGACSHIQRTYGDFFTFQNKLLDIFPEESGQRSKKQRVIPFLPGRKLLSGRTNRELAEKRLPDLWKYTHDLFTLPEHISQCKHVIDFFRPRQTDARDEILANHKITTLADMKNAKPRGSVSFLNSSSPSSSPSRPHSAIQHVLNPSSASPSARSSNTLPAQQSPGQKDSNQINRRSTYPARPSGTSAFTVVTPTGSSEKLHSLSQTSITSTNEVLNPPTTVACHVVTPPTSRSNGSPAFSVSNNKFNSPVGGGGGVWDSESPTVIKFVRSGKSKGDKGEKSKESKRKNSKESNSSSSLNKADTLTHKSAPSWADRCDSPPNIESSLSPFQTVTTTYNTPPTSSTHRTTTPSVVPSSAPPETGSLSFSPSLPQLYQYGLHTPLYPISYTPTHFDTPSPKPTPLGSRTPGTPTTEAEHFKKWLKCHRLHKYDNLFTNMSFEEVTKLTVENLKSIGMTQGAAKKLSQKLNEQLINGATSFRDMPIPAISRRPSTTSLPAALLLERQQLTPSSSIDQLSLHGGSTCSLDVLGHSYSHHSTPKHLHRHSDSISDANTVDTAILEAGPSSNVYTRGGNEIDGSRGNTVNGQSRLSYTSSSPLHWAPTPYVVTTPTDKDTELKDEFNRPTYSHKKESDHQPRLPHRLVPQGTTNRMQGIVASNWPHPLPAPPPTVPPQMVRGVHRNSQPVLTYTQTVNGLVRSSPVLHAGSGPPSNRYSAPPIQQSLATPQIYYSSSSRSPGPSPSSSYSCYNCGNRGHQGVTCPLLYTSPPSSSSNNSALLRS